MSTNPVLVLGRLQLCRWVLVLLAVCGALLPLSAAAQDQPAAAAAAQPPVVIPLSGVSIAADGSARSGAVQLTLSLYATQDDPTPRWVETQTVTLDPSGRYSVQFGATRPEGLPGDLFATGETRFVGVSVNGEPEGARMMLLSVAYASKAAVADTLGGRTADDFVLANNLGEAVKTALHNAPSTSDADEPGPNDLTGVGTTGTIVKYTNGALEQVGNSLITESAGGSIGIGGTSAVGLMYRLSLKTAAGSRLLSAYTNSDFAPGIGSGFAIETGAPSGNTFSQMYAFSGGGGVGNALVFNPNGGNVGIGTGGTSPLYKMTIKGSSGSTLLGLLTNNDFGGGVGSGFAIETGAASGNTYSKMYAFANGGGAVADLIFNPGGGNVGIGTTAPSAKLAVNGNVAITGDVTVSGNIGAKYQDVAEWVDAIEELEPGTLVVIDPATTNRVVPSSRAYDARVAGAVSAQPGVVLGEGGPGRELVAQSGRVKVKADARYGAIRPGDLLVSSPTKGHVMRSKPINVGGQWIHRPGTLIGKALEALPNGRGEILVLLTLQ